MLPGPGLLMLFGGLAVLSQQYDWAERRVAPIERRAKKGAAESVETWPRIVLSSLFALGLVACGVLWIWGPPAPDVVADRARRCGCPAASPPASPRSPRGSSRSRLIVWSYRRYHGNPEAVAAIERELSAGRGGGGD